MPKCDASNYILKVTVPDGLQGVVDHKDHRGDESKALLETLLDKGSKIEAVLCNSVMPNRKFRNREAVWVSPEDSNTTRGAFLFADMLCNTTSISDRLRVERDNVVAAIDRGLLRGLKSHSGFFRLIVKDKLYDTITKDMILGIKSESKIDVRGRGLTSMAREAIRQGLLPNDFSRDDLISALEKMGWKKNRDYAPSSIPGVLQVLGAESIISIKKNGPSGKRIWTLKQASATVAPRLSTVSKAVEDIVERFSDEIVVLVESRAKEKLGL